MPNRARPMSVRREPMRPAKHSTSPLWRSNETSLKTPSRARSRTASSRSPCSLAAVFKRETVDRAADHVADEAVLGDFGDRLRRDVPAVAQHGHAVGDAEDLVEPVGDVEHGDPALLQRAGDRQQPVDLVRRQRRGRLVHDQHLDVERQRAGDLDGLLLGERQAGGGAADVEVDAEPGDQLLGLANRASSNPSAGFAGDG